MGGNSDLTLAYRVKCSRPRSLGGMFTLMNLSWSGAMFRRGEIQASEAPSQTIRPWPLNDDFPISISPELALFILARKS